MSGHQTRSQCQHLLFKRSKKCARIYCAAHYMAHARPQSLHRRSKQVGQRHRPSWAFWCSCSFCFLSQAIIWAFYWFLMAAPRVLMTPVCCAYRLTERGRPSRPVFGLAKTTRCHSEQRAASSEQRGAAAGTTPLDTTWRCTMYNFVNIAGLAINPVRVYWTLRAHHWEFLRLWTGFELSSSWRRLPCYGASTNRSGFCVMG